MPRIAPPPRFERRPRRHAITWHLAAPVAAPYHWDTNEGHQTVNVAAEVTEFVDRSLLIVEDDKAFLERLSRAMETRGFTVTSCDNVSEGLTQIGRAPPAFAVVDLRLGDGNGLDVVSALKSKRPDARAIVLTGYGNIATAVTAVKMGAVDYLSKPADADDVVAALLASGSDKSGLPENPMSADRVRWEHIQRIYEMCDRNVSETARRLNMHRRTLQRILAKRAPR
jgi:two-component system response regulator RegA